MLRLLAPFLLHKHCHCSCAVLVASLMQISVASAILQTISVQKKQLQTEASSWKVVCPEAAILLLLPVQQSADHDINEEGKKGLRDRLYRCICLCRSCNNSIVDSAHMQKNKPTARHKRICCASATQLLIRPKACIILAIRYGKDDAVDGPVSRQTVAGPLDNKCIYSCT